MLCRYIPPTKTSDVPSNANVRQNQIVAQQIHSLKTTINHLKNAYNGNDIEWSDTGKDALLNPIMQFSDGHLSTEDSEDHYESGSGSGSGIDDDDDDDSGSGEISIDINCLSTQLIPFNRISSGLNAYPDEIQPDIIPPHNPTDPGTRHNTNTHDVVRNNIDDEHSSTDDQDLTEGAREPKTHSGSSSRETWRAKRLILTYFLPIVMAWFGGSISGAVADLL